MLTCSHTLIHSHSRPHLLTIPPLFRQETVVGWYHSHPGFGCWLSSVDINTQQSFEQLTPRAVAVVVDPIQSVKGKVVIDAFRLINPQTLMMGHEPRQTTSNVGHLNKPSIQALIHGLNRHYYSIGIDYRKSALEENMLMNLHKHVWTEALEMDDFNVEGERNQDRLQKLVSLAEGYEQRVKEETELTKDQLKTRYVGKVDPKKRTCDNIDCSRRKHSANSRCRHLRRRPAAHRRQHRIRIETDDRQRGLGTEAQCKAEWASVSGRGRRDGRVGLDQDRRAHHSSEQIAHQDCFCRRTKRTQGIEAWFCGSIIHGQQATERQRTHDQESLVRAST